MERTHDADTLAASNDHRDLARMQRRMGPRDELDRLSRQREQRFDVALDVVEIDGPGLMRPLFGDRRSHRDPADHRRLAELAAIVDEDESGFEQPHPRLLAVDVVRRCADEARPQRRAHDPHLRGDGVGEGEALEPRRDARLQVRVHEAVGHRLVIPVVHEQLADAPDADVALRLRGDVQIGGRHCPRESLEADDPRDLLDEIDLGRDVRAIRRRGHDPALPRFLHTHPEADEDVADLVRRDLGSKHAPDARVP